MRLGLNFLNQPVPIFPAVGGLSLGFASYGGQEWIWFSFCLTIVATVGTIFAQCYSLTYRFVIFKSTWRWMNLFQKKLTHFTICGYGIFATIFIISGVILIRGDPDAFRLQATNLSMIPIRS
uniref:Uncharacterized protein n=1 Tax=Panagrolaimus sp. PS1159 TaxID=55785 RepID=A0AC35GIG5_9BILA